MQAIGVDLARYQGRFGSSWVLVLPLQGVFFVVENPTGSFLFQHPEVQRALELCKATKVTVHLLGFKGETMKPLWLAGTAPWLGTLARQSADLLRSVPRSSATTLATRKGSQVNGNTMEMRASQEYPVAFSAMVAKLHKSFLVTNMPP